jgi:nucleotide-binding universal stress UspA family protein
MTRTTGPEISIGTDQSTAARERERFPVRVNTILVPTDLTKESDRAIESGVVLAKLFGARLTLLHVYQDPCYTVEYMLGPHAQDPALQDKIYFENTLKTIARGVQKRYPHCDVALRDGVPCEEIVRAAKELDVDLIIISTHHYNWLIRLAFGCDGEQILREAPCPLLILQAK